MRFRIGGKESEKNTSMDKIRLLDGEEHEVKPLLKKMEDDAFYYGELNQLALSSSSLKLLVDSPKKYHYIQKYGQGESQGLRDGALLHTLILEPQKFDKLHFVDVASKNTKKYKEAVEEFGLVYTKTERETAEKLADAILKNEEALRLMSYSEFEVPAIGEVMGMPFRGKADILGENRICDVKTCSDIKGFSYSAKKYGYDIQVYLYCNLFNIPFENFKFLFIDKGSLDIGVFEISESFYLQGEDKVQYGIEMYKDFFQDKEPQLDDYIIKGIL